MKVLFVLCLAVALSAASDVLILTSDNFNEVVEGNSPLLVQFYAPWCGHCKNLAPEYEKAATALKEHGIRIAKVDATAHESLAQQFQIQGFPTLKLFKNGVFVQDFQGARDADGIAAYMIKKASDPYKTISSQEEASAELAASEGGVVIGYFTDLESDDFLDFKHVADQDLQIPFLLVSEAANADGCVPGMEDGSIAVLDKDGATHQFDGDDIEEDLPAFAVEKGFPQSMELNPHLFAQFLKSSIVVVAAYDLEEGETFKKMASDVIKAHPALKQNFADSTTWGQALVRMGVVSGNVYPTFIVFKPEGGAPLSWDEDNEVTAESYAAWLKEVVAGTAKTWEKSEPIPASNDGPVTVLVRKNWAQYVNENANVLVEFYAPWCGHCKNLAPIYEEVGAHFASNDKVVIAKIDATANYVEPELGVRGFPTLKLFTADGDIVDYEGDRTKDDIISFVEDNA